MRVSGAALLLLLAAACEEPDFYAFRSQTSPGPNQGFTGVVVFVSDSPVDAAESVFVVVERVELDGTVLFAGRREFDLLALQNGRRALLAEAAAAPGSYRRLRIRLKECRLVTGREVRPVALEQPWIDLLGPFLVRDGERLELQVDLNARLSILEAGGRWRLDPVARFVDPGGAALGGRVELARPGIATISAQRDGRERLSTRTRPDGSFRLAPLEPGGYTLVASAPGHRPEVRPALTGTDQHILLDAAETRSIEGLAPPGVTRVRLLWNGAVLDVAGVDPETGRYRFTRVPAGLDCVVRD